MKRTKNDDLHKKPLWLVVLMALAWTIVFFIFYAIHGYVS
jgi:hypothetical protein